MSFTKKFNELYEKTKNIQPTEREYDLEISGFVSEYGSVENEDKFMKLEDLIKQPEDEKSFLAFFVLHTYLRRNKRYRAIANLEDKHRAIHGSNPAFDILHLRLEINIPDMPDLERIEYGKRLSEKFKDNDGVNNDFCMMLADVYEQGTENIRSDIEQNFIKDAKEKIDRVSEGKYPKFLWTKARIYFILSGMETNETERKKYYDISLKSIREAWMSEEYGEQYDTRIATYRNYEVFIKNNYMLESTKRELKKIGNEQNEMLENVKKEISGMKTENLELLGFFVAIISFTIGQLNVAETESFIERICTIVVLMSSLLVVYGGLGIILHGKEKCGRSICIIVIGVFLIAASVVTGIALT